MPTSSEFDVEARYASLDERVRNQGAQIAGLEQEMRRSFSALSTGLDAINAKLADTSKPQWQALGVMLTAIVVVGTLAYWPIREAQSRIEATVADQARLINERFGSVVTLQQFAEFRSTYENNRALTRVDMNARFEKLERGLETVVPREEHERVWIGLDQRFAEMRRQIDQNTALNTNVYTARDQIIDMRNEIDNLRKMLIPSTATGVVGR